MLIEWTVKAQQLIKHIKYDELVGSVLGTETRDYRKSINVGLLPILAINYAANNSTYCLMQEVPSLTSLGPKPIKKAGVIDIFTER